MEIATRFSALAPKRSPLCGVGVRVLRDRRKNSTGLCHAKLSVLDRGQLLSPRGPPRHHRTELEGRDPLVFGKHPVPIQNQPAARSRVKSAERAPVPNFSAERIPVPESSTERAPDPMSSPRRAPVSKSRATVPELGLQRASEADILPMDFLFIFWVGGISRGPSVEAGPSAELCYDLLNCLLCHGFLNSLLHHDFLNCLLHHGPQKLPAPPWSPEFLAPPWLPSLPDLPWRLKLPDLPWVPECPWTHLPGGGSNIRLCSCLVLCSPPPCAP
ncbi:uncharacterized protein LOC122139720 [Cyprinus carpio]|uniref:Uncharacterized protein LOC122139720 n=1 Tax=Cyprinus carpio TaxID=7962 RepID=A0A9Q9X3X4_CYPCA|nr:uncharacterized protein LOC122139720 [Cyprinus carpio]